MYKITDAHRKVDTVVAPTAASTKVHWVDPLGNYLLTLTDEFRTLNLTVKHYQIAID